MGNIIKFLIITVFSIINFSVCDENGVLIQTVPESVFVIQQVDSYNIEFNQITDLAPDIQGPTIYLLDGREGKPTSVNIVLDDPNQYDTGSIKWHINGTSITGTGGAFLLDSSVLSQDIGVYFLTIEVEKNGVPYNKTIVFTVEP
jgi:hypothetical protein